MGSFFGGGFQRKRRGRDIQLSLRISFRESIYGVDKTVSIPDLKDGQDNNSNKQVQVTIPAGIENGQRLKVPGYGEQLSEGQAGNLLLQMIVDTHEMFKREGRHITTALDVKLTDAINGSKFEITDLNDKKINGIRILEHQETPGLGAKITDEEYKGNFKGKPFSEDYNVIKRETSDPYKVKAIAGATISSQKVTNIVEGAVQEFETAYGGGN
jgi:DnaJ-class molecular chaperone